MLTDGLASIDAFVTSFQPARALAGAVPLLVLAVVLVIDPPTTLVLLFTGPILVLLLGFIGGRARVITEQRFAEVRWLSAFFLDMLGGLATLKMFGRSREQVDTIRDISRRYGDTTMEVLRTAFQTSLVLEWGGAVAVALVAVEISLRLMDGSIEFGRALAVLIIVPEFFLPLRTLATRYHSGAAGRAVAERAFAILDEPRPSRGVVAAADAGATAHAVATADRAAPGPSPAPRSRPTARSGSRPCRSPTRAERSRPSTGWTSASRLPAWSRWSARREPESRRWRACCCGSSSPTPAPSSSATRRWRRSIRRPGGHA